MARVWSPLLLGLSLLPSGCQQLNLPAPGDAQRADEAEQARAASAATPQPAATWEAPSFPKSLGLEGATWDHVLRIARVWGRDGAEVPEWSAGLGLAPMYPGADRPVVFSFQSDAALSKAVAPWGRPFASERSGKCHLWWFNPAAALRGDVQLEKLPSESGCPQSGPTTLALRFSHYSSIEALVPLPDGRFPFEGKTRLIGLAESEVKARFTAKEGEGKRLSVAPFEDAWDDATLDVRYKDGAVRRFQLHSAHSPEFADPTRADAAFAKAFGKPSREFEAGPIWREYRQGGLAIEVGRGLCSLSVTAEACEHWSRAQLARGRDEALAAWIDQRAAANGDTKAGYLVRTHHGPEHSTRTLIERKIDSCQTELWSVSWEKPDCAPASILAEERFFSACCDKQCQPDPRQLLFRLLGATTDGDLTALSALLPPIGSVPVGHRYPGGEWSVPLSRAEVDSEKRDALPTWSRISATSEQIVCAPSPDDGALNVCKISGSVRFKIEFRGAYLESVVSLAK